VDLSKIDFDKLAKRFERSRKRTEAERLQALITMKLSELIRRNRSRVDFLEKFQKMIDEYNAGSKNIEQFFKELVKFAQSLTDEEKRSVAEKLSEEELALFDILTKPEPKLSKKEEEQVKKVAKTLLETLKKEKLVLDWRAKQQARAAVRKAIGRAFATSLPSIYSEDMQRDKCDRAYAHIYDSYFGAGRSVYAAN
jgi:type I restriction enzyme R subunit